jgi:serine/threonine-protein kinase
LWSVRSSHILVRVTTSAGPRSAQLPRAGDIVAGKYVLERLLGQGGMGAVFAAKHVKLGKPVAIKIMLADRSNPEASARFINEGRAAANIQNEHVVRVDDVDEEMGYAYMVLELLEGQDLSQLLEHLPQKRLPPHVAVDYVLQALRGIIQAHAMGIVHRDLKPSNLFLAKRKDGSEVVKVLDFGISKQQASSAFAASPGALTSTQAMLGSPLYMSPEQLRSSKSVDQRSDIWALGVILYELITGTLPFNGESLGELFAAILETDPLPPSKRVDGVPPGLEQIILRCLQRRPEHRFQTASELAAALAPFALAYRGAGATAALGAPQSFAVTPSAASSDPHLAPAPAAIGSLPALGGTGSSSTGIGPQPRPVGGTVALGAATPQNLQHTTGGWQSTGGASTAAAPKTKAPLVVGLVAAALGLFGVIGGVFIVLAKRPTALDAATGASVTVSATAPPTPASVSTPPTPSTTETAPVASASAIASASATATATTTAVKTTPIPPTRPTQTAHTRPGPTTTATTSTKQPEPPIPKPPKTSDPTQTTR